MLNSSQAGGSLHYNHLNLPFKFQGGFFEVLDDRLQILGQLFEVFLVEFGEFQSDRLRVEVNEAATPVELHIAPRIAHARRTAPG